MSLMIDKLNDCIAYFESFKSAKHIKIKELKERIKYLEEKDQERRELIEKNKELIAIINEIKIRINHCCSTSSIDKNIENVGKPYANYVGDYIGAILSFVLDWFNELESD